MDLKLAVAWKHKLMGTLAVKLSVINYNTGAVRVIWPILRCPGAVCNQLAPHGYQMDGNH